MHPMIMEEKRLSTCLSPSFYEMSMFFLPRKECPYDYPRARNFYYELQGSQFADELDDLFSTGLEFPDMGLIKWRLNILWSIRRTHAPAR